MSKQSKSHEFLKLVERHLDVNKRLKKDVVHIVGRFQPKSIMVAALIAYLETDASFLELYPESACVQDPVKVLRPFISECLPPRLQELIDQIGKTK